MRMRKNSFLCILCSWVVRVNNVVKEDQKIFLIYE